MSSGVPVVTCAAQVMVPTHPVPAHTHATATATTLAIATLTTAIAAQPCTPGEWTLAEYPVELHCFLSLYIGRLGK